MENDTDASLWDQLGLERESVVEQMPDSMWESMLRVAVDPDTAPVEGDLIPGADGDDLGDDDMVDPMLVVDLPHGASSSDNIDDDFSHHQHEDAQHRHDIDPLHDQQAHDHLHPVDGTPAEHLDIQSDTEADDFEW